MTIFGIRGQICSLCKFCSQHLFGTFCKILFFHRLRAIVRPEGFLYGAMNSKIVRMNKKGGQEQVSGLDCIRHFLLERLCVVCIQSSGHPV
jgi:hypothetical protein